MGKKIIITVGGTGGHVYPAMALARQLMKQDSSLEILFIGGGLTKNRFFDRNSFLHHEVSCGNLSKRNPLSLLYDAGKISTGIWSSFRLLKRFQPDLIVGFGSYHTVPVLAAANLCRIPFILHEANSVPGKVNRFFSKYALATGVYFPESIKRLKGKAEEVGLPLREGYQNTHHEKMKARESFQLDPQKLTLLVFGGSQGARAINQLFVESIQFLSRDLIEKIQVLHFTGETALKEKIELTYAENGLKSVVKVYEPQMDIAWAAADLMVSRSGAGTIAEAIAFGVPGILIPYPYAMDNHQEKNADFMVDRVKGAIKLEEKSLTPIHLAQEVEKLLMNGYEGLNYIKAALEEYQQVSPTRDFYTLVQDFLRNRSVS